MLPQCEVQARLQALVEQQTCPSAPDHGNHFESLDGRLHAQGQRLEWLRRIVRPSNLQERIPTDPPHSVPVHVLTVVAYYVAHLRLTVGTRDLD